MYTYHFGEWLIFFYFYCICGWCFESAYVSIRQRRLVNRGFLHGPWLPIYGSGAVTVLWLTLPFRAYPWAVYLIGMAGATLLELCTGEAMVRLFRVRYWDYSNQKFQFRGHICLSSSVLWGFFSMAMVYVVHEPVADFILGLNGEFLSVSSYVVTILFVADFTMAFRRAMDLRRMLEQAERLRAQLGEIAVEKKRVMEAAAVFTKDALQKEMEERRRAAYEAAALTKETISREVGEKGRTAYEAAVLTKDTISRGVGETRRAACEAAALTKDTIVREVGQTRRAVAEAAASTRDTLREQADETFTAIRESGGYLQERLHLQEQQRARMMERLQESRRLSKKLENVTRRAARSSVRVLKQNPTARFMIESELAESIRGQLKKFRGEA